MTTKGFTLAELLIALAILGVIAIFTIPKLIAAQQNRQYDSMAKEAMAAVSSAYILYKQNNSISATTRPIDFMPYINYVQYDTVSSIDAAYGSAVVEPCSGNAWRACALLHHGGILEFTTCSFGGSATTNAMIFRFDPDGTYDASLTGPAKTLVFYLYYNGRVVDIGNIIPGTFSGCGGPENPSPALVPPWFNWG